MLDKRSVRLLSALTQICADGSYKIIEVGDLIKAMLPRFKVESAELAQILRFLRDNDMIDVKYSDENVHCVSVLPKGRVYNETTRNDERGKRFERYGWMLLVGACFIASFLGAFLAGLIK